MQRKASYLFAGLALVSFVGGCSLFGKKKEADMQATDPYLMDAGSTDPSSAYGAPVADSSYGAPTGGGRVHTVQKSETLYSLARTYYNDQRRWKDIYEANKSAMGGDPNKIFVGQRLTIP